MEEQIEEKDHPIHEEIAEFDDGIVVFEGYEDCVIGVADVPGKGKVTAYSFCKVVIKTMELDEVLYDDAIDHVSFNMTQAYMGDKTPVFIYCLPSKCDCMGDSDE